jgi:hypothetical protein
MNPIDDDPLLKLYGDGKDLWADEDADEYVRRLREGWDEDANRRENGDSPQVLATEQGSKRYPVRYQLRIHILEAAAAACLLGLALMFSLEFRRRKREREGRTSPGQSPSR